MKLSFKQKRDMIKKGLNLDKFIHDESWLVKRMMVKQELLLNELVHDKDWRVRREIALKGYGHEILVHDESHLVRLEIAKQRSLLEVLIRDKNPLVRLELVRQGCGLHILVNDEDETVKKLASELLNLTPYKISTNFPLYFYVSEDGEYKIIFEDSIFTSLEEWHESGTLPIDVADDCRIIMEDILTSPELCSEYKIDNDIDFVIYNDSDNSTPISEEKRMMIEKGKNLETLLNDGVVEVRVLLAEKGYFLDKLVHDPEWCVREKVAEKGYGHEILVHDESVHVRMMVARKGSFLHLLINDESYAVRWSVAKQNYKLNILMNDPDPCVRLEVASQGYGLEILKNDDDELVRETAKELLKSTSYKIVYNPEEMFQPLYFHRFGKRKYRIVFGDIIYNSLDSWWNDCKLEYSEEIANKYKVIMKNILTAPELHDEYLLNTVD